MNAIAEKMRSGIVAVPVWTHWSPRAHCHGRFARGQTQFGTDTMQAGFCLAGSRQVRASCFGRQVCSGLLPGDSLMASLARSVRAGWLVGRWSADWRLLSRLVFDRLVWLCMLCTGNLLYSTLRLQGWSVAVFSPDSPNQLQQGQSAESHQPPNQSELAMLPI